MTGTFDRRQFLGATAAGAAGLALAGRTAFASGQPSETVVVGVMGLSRGAALATGFAKLKGCEVKYVCDVDSDRAAKCAEAVAGVRDKKPMAVGDFRKILDDPDVDALVCAAPNHWHAPATILACKADKHVYVEKPCSHNPREGELMVEAARRHNRCVQMGTQRRSGPGTREAMQKLAEGAIGRVSLVRSFYNNVRGPIGKGQSADPPAHLDYDLWQGPAPHVPYMDNRVHYNWHWLWHWGNGELGNNGVHTLDLCRWGAAVDYPIRVTSSGGRYRFDDDQETPDTHTVCFEFPGDRQITWQGLSCNRHGGGFVSFFGEGGALDLESNGTHTIYDDRDKEVSRTPSPSLGDAEHLENFLAAIRSGKPLSLNAEIEQGHKSTLLCHLGNIAHRTGRTLTCNPHNGRILGDAEAMKLWQRDYEPGWEPTV
ncbi:MAG TPA: Gfo/Idh/MocA family oxidoreductase [Planctomycetaceae bacterium]|nr:Gfo/Idh/MocA family oxidoreductase [Planctomycetaceae bacterium]